MCCDGDCNGLCLSCAVIGTEGSCSPIPTGDSDVADRCGLASCDGAGDCAYAMGRWTRTFDTSASVRAVAAMPNGHTLIGVKYDETTPVSFGGMSFVGPGKGLVIVDQAGNHVASTFFPTTDSLGRYTMKVQPLSDGDIIVILEFGASIQIGAAHHTSATSPAFVVSRLTPSLQRVWSWDSAAVALEIAGIASASDMVLVGTVEESIDLNGVPIPSRPDEDVFQAKVDLMTGAITATSVFASSGDDRVYDALVVDRDVVVATAGTVRAISSSSDLVWSFTHGASLYLPQLAIANDGTVIVGCGFGGTLDIGTRTIVSKGEADIVVFALSPSGDEVLWSVAHGGVGYDYLHALDTDGHGDIVVVGQLGDGTNGNADIFLAKLSADGDLRWLQDLQAADNQLAAAADVFTDGDVVLGGSFGGNLDLGAGAFTSEGPEADLFIGRIGP